MKQHDTDRLVSTGFLSPGVLEVQKVGGPIGNALARPEDELVNATLRYSVNALP